MGDIFDTVNKILESKEKEYNPSGDKYLVHEKLGKILKITFPNGIPSDCSELDWARLITFILIQSKFQRYANNFFTGGHTDSIHDWAGYTKKLYELDCKRIDNCSVKESPKATNNYYRCNFGSYDKRDGCILPNGHRGTHCFLR